MSRRDEGRYSLVAVALAFLLGDLFLQMQARLPHPLWTLALPIVGLAVSYRPAWMPLFWAVAGFCWALLRAHWFLSVQLPPALEGETVIMEGRVSGLPEQAEDRYRFAFDTETLFRQGREQPGCGRVRLDWSHPPEDPRSGERWRLAVRLKRPHGLSNPGGFDYEKWLYQEGIHATGYVVDEEPARRLAAAGMSVDALRAGLRSRLQEAIGFHPLSGVVIALAIGAQDGIGPEQWRVFFRAGVGHLIAISGLHIGLLAGLGYFLGGWLWSLPGRTLLLVPAPRIAALTAFLAALAYGLLAGFSVPTQRTVIMIGAAMWVLWAQRPRRELDSLMAALIVVLLIDPAAVLAVGFWLSFVAVAILLYSTGGRRGRGGLWWKLGRTHLAIAIGLAPLMMLLFEQNPVLGPLANLVAVPWVSFVVVPLVLAGTALLLCSPFLGYWFLSGALLALQGLWKFLEPLAGWPGAVWHQAAPAPWVSAGAFVGAALLLLPRGIPGRALGLLWMSPLLWSGLERPPPGEAWFTLLDVGQGLSAVVQTHAHVLVYDTGPALNPRFDTGSSVVVPFLYHEGVRRIDMLMVSHGDNDHIGGAASILREFPVGGVLSSVPERLAYAGARPCEAGQRWRWDGVEFEVLHPAPGEFSSGNNSSCVLRVATAAGARLLLTGDIEAPAERELVRAQPAALRAEALVAPHHGSKTSSTTAFVDAVAPRYVFFPVGYRNRFHHPHPSVRARYRDAGVTALATDADGAISWRLGGEAAPPAGYRRTHQHYWNAD
ncbi:MAG TPA: DNA internalization-related competence protein ComEC/Rec2 [Gammaproteobacteria bacterium]|nr:DNA internalization-related competence protein ComEC/Rec2 [Gammaproteobacteria bacterium]